MPDILVLDETNPKLQILQNKNIIKNIFLQFKRNIIFVFYIFSDKKILIFHFITHDNVETFKKSRKKIDNIRDIDGRKFYKVLKKYNLYL